MSAPFALLSVTDKTDLHLLAQALVKHGYELLSTGGTSRHLQQHDLPVTDVSTYTGFPEMMEGRLKTLHPRVHGGLLGRPDHASDVASMNEHGIRRIPIVVINLYSFEQTIAREGVSIAECIEQIDIGGPSMVRSAAKNHAHVAIVSSPAQYSRVIEALNQGELTLEFRRELAAAAFEITARYDRAISDYFLKITTPPDDDCELPRRLTLTLDRQLPLRYGENPHQPAAFYAEQPVLPGTLASARQVHGKELSYNNLLDLDAALSIVREFADPACVVIKHTNPCGCAEDSTLAGAFTAAYAGDPVSAFGSIIGFNRPLDAATAEMLCEPNRFIEAIIAPGFEPAALQMLTTKPKWKANVRLLECPSLSESYGETWEYRRVTGGMLVQHRDEGADPETEWTIPTERQPTESELAQLRFAWRVCKHVKSNAIVLCQGRSIVGVGAGQMSRVDSAFIAAHKAGDRSQGAVVASDAFFPFRDGVDELARHGVKAVIQPGGSKGDPEVIASCNEHGLAMIFTGRRHFRH